LEENDEPQQREESPSPSESPTTVSRQRSWKKATTAQSLDTLKHLDEEIKKNKELEEEKINLTKQIESMKDQLWKLNGELEKEKKRNQELNSQLDESKQNIIKMSIERIEMKNSSTGSSSQVPNSLTTEVQYPKPKRSLSAAPAVEKELFKETSKNTHHHEDNLDEVKKKLKKRDQIKTKIGRGLS